MSYLQLRRLEDVRMLFVTEEVLNKFRCFLCKQYLSQLPVYIYPEQERMACGRCPLLPEKNPVRDVGYEMLGRYFLFPCRYEVHGCVETVSCNQTQSHEESCSYKRYFCPFIPFIPLSLCSWQGPAKDLFLHYSDDHEELVLPSSTFKIDLTNKYGCNYLLWEQGQLFIIYVKSDAIEEFFCSVHLIGNPKVVDQIHYQVKFMGNDSTESILLSKRTVDSDLSIPSDNSKATRVKLAEIKKILGNECSTLLCSICISSNELNNIDTTDSQDDIKNTTNTSADNLESHIYTELKCPVCKSYMVPPIYQCGAGHSICSTCKPSLSYCSVCRQARTNTRNFSLENMTQIIKYHCKYRDLDCPFSSNVNEIKNHEANCKFGSFKCPYNDIRKCDWNGKFHDIIDHFEDSHEGNILKGDYLTWNIVNTQAPQNVNDCYLIKSFGCIFRIILKFASGNFYWSLQYIGSPEEAEKFLYELDIGDNSGFNQRMYIKKKCCAVLPFTDSFTDYSNHIQVPYNSIKSLINGKDMVYKVRVVKEAK